MVQWLRLHASNAGGPGLIPDQGTRARMPKGFQAMSKDLVCFDEHQRSRLSHLRLAQLN